MINNIKENVNPLIDKILAKLRTKHPRLAALIKYTAEFVRNVGNDNVGLYAAQSAFYAMLSAVPFFMLVILCLKYFVNVNMSSITMPIHRAFPAPVSTYIVRIIGEVFYRAESVALFSATIITALWSSSRGTMAIYTGLNRIYGYTRYKNWLFSRIVSFIYNLLFIVVIVATIVTLVFGNTILSFMDREFIVAHYVVTLFFSLKFPIFFVLFILGFAAIYTFLPQRKAKYKSQLPGAVATAAGWIGFSFLFSIYIMHFSRYSFLYGSLTAIVLLMLWILACVYMLLWGAEINKHIADGFFKNLKKDVFYTKK